MQAIHHMTTPSRMLKPHSCDDSGELHVFEAAQYFSGEVNDVGLGLQRAWRAERRSLDTPLQAALFQEPREVESQFKDKKQKEPSSPGGKLANFLSSFFRQAVSKKKSKSVTPTQSSKDGESVERHARRRRSSIDHPGNMRSRESKSMIFSSEIGSLHGVPPPYPNNHADKRVMEEVLRAERAESTEKYADENRWVMSKGGDKLYEKDTRWAEVFIERVDKWCSRREEEEEDGWGSDSSSDLFELKSYDLGV